VTLANPAVVRELQTHFVLLWHDQTGGTRPLPEPGTPEQARDYPEGSGGRAVQTYVAAPDGRAVLRLEGFWRPDRYLAELEFGRELAADVGKRPHDPVAVRFAAERLDARARAVGAERAAVERAYPTQFIKCGSLSDAFRRHAALGLLEKTLGPEGRPNLAAVEAIVGRLSRSPFT